MAVTFTFASGLAFRKRAANSGRRSPSVPMAQTLISPLAGESLMGAPLAPPLPCVSDRPQPARTSVAARPPMSAFDQCEVDILVSSPPGGCVSGSTARRGVGQRDRTAKTEQVPYFQPE